jgi:transcriptional regulator with XRE-family HTH domain
MDKNAQQFLDDVLARDPELQSAWRVHKPRARIAGALTRLRRTLGWSQADVASRIDNAHQSNIARMERAVGNPQTTDSLIAYAQACGMVLGVVFMAQDDRGEWRITEATAVDDQPGADEFLRSKIRSEESALPADYGRAAAAAAE